HELKGLLLNYLLSSRQEQEVMEAKMKMEIFYKNLASIEGEYTSVKEKLTKEMEDLKTSHKDELAKLKKGCDDQLTKMKEDHAAEVEKLK
ncbi:hypothetical protein A2U01_0080946, partial [Trifolium medium]|nr:hypothetical protein [Trifolium medium]